MWIMMGSLSGKGALPSNQTEGWWQAGMFVMRGSLGWNINLRESASLKQATLTGALRDVPNLTPEGLRGLYVTASTNVFPTDTTSNEYFIDEATYLGWDDLRGFQSIDGNRFGMGRKLTAIQGTQDVNFLQFGVNNQDSVNWIGAYSTVGDIITEADRQSIDPVYDDRITIPVDSGLAPDIDVMILAVSHQTPLDIPSGWAIDFSSTVKGTNPLTPVNERSRSLTVLRKRVTSFDISEGSIVIKSVGAP